MDTEDIEDQTCIVKFTICPKKLQILNTKAKKWPMYLFAIGTTSVRTLELYKSLLVFECSGETKLFIYSGYQWHTIDGMLTNFHLPKSTLIMMIMSFVGYEFTLEAYRHAVQEKYLLFSFMTDVNYQ